MTLAVSHLLILPIVVPIAAAALMLLVGDQRRHFKSALNLGATALELLVAVSLLRAVEGSGADGHDGAIQVLLVGNWEAPFGIVLVADRLAALFLVLTGAIGLAVAVYATAAWSRMGVYFHPLFQAQLLGLHGAFLTGDLFNLFVFFEVMLAASYGLQLHGSGEGRVRAGVHYIVVNLFASSLFLIGLAILYGVTGTLSMADLAAKLPLVAPADRGLLHAGMAVLAVAFLTKAAAWPLNAWLVPAYLTASAPAAAIFTLLTKVGAYALLRLSSLLLSPDAGASAGFGADVLFVGGLVTLAVGSLGLLSSLRIGRIAGYAILVSSGTLLAAIGSSAAATTAAALFYLLAATLGASALFLLIELIDRTGTGDQVPLPDVDLVPGEDTNLDDDAEPLVGRAFPISLALLGLAFIACALVVAGIPPFAGFVGKLALLLSLAPAIAGTGEPGASATGAWAFGGLLLLSGLAALVAFSRAGIRHFWSVAHRPPTGLRLVEAAPVLALLAAAAALTVQGDSVLRYTHATAEALHAPQTYIDAVLGARPRPGPTRPNVERLSAESAR